MYLSYVFMNCIEIYIFESRNVIESKMVFENVGPGAYFAFGISLPLVAAFVVTHLYDLKGSSKMKEPRESHHIHLLR